MQRVKSTTELIHPLMSELEVLYAELSVKEQTQTLVTPKHDKRLSDIVNLFVDFGYVDHTFEYLDLPVKKLDLPKFDSKNIIVCYSGGKDSFVTAKHYQKLGYNVYLYHLKGLNATYCGKSSESVVAEDGANYLGLPLIIEEISYSGYHEWTEHPMKNMLLVNRALTYGITHGITDKIAVGTFTTASVMLNMFDVCGGDCMEMWKAYENVVRAFIPNFHMYISTRNYQTAYNYLLKEPQAIAHTSSCMTPNRFKNHFRQRTMRNNHIELLPYRCGCCWKDAVEYIWMVDHDIFELNRDYYLHCLETLRGVHVKESHYRIVPMTLLWEEYFFYPMSKSKLYKEIKDATFSPKGKIKYPKDTTEG